MSDATPKEPPVRAYSCDVLLQLCTLEATLAAKKQQTERLRAMAERALHKQHQIWHQKRELADATARVDEKKQRLMERTRQVEEASSFAETVNEQINDVRQQTIEAQARVRKAGAEVQVCREKLRQDRIISEDLRAMLARRRAEYAAALIDIYPIGTDDAGQWCICGMRIEQEAALSMVAEVLCVLARICAVPLRYPLRVSRAQWVVRSPTAVPAEAPLAQGVRWLEVNVEQLLEAYGVAVNRQPILANLLQLLMTVEATSFAR